MTGTGILVLSGPSLADFVIGSGGVFSKLGAITLHIKTVSEPVATARHGAA